MNPVFQFDGIFTVPKHHSEKVRAVSTVVFSAASTTMAVLVVFGCYLAAHNQFHNGWSFSGFLLALTAWICWYQQTTLSVPGIAQRPGAAAMDSSESKEPPHTPPPPALELAGQTALLDFALDAIVIRDLNQRLVYWNPAAAHLFGWTFDEARDMDLLAFFPESEQDRFAGALEAFRERGEWEGELTYNAKTGTPLTVQARWSQIRNANCQPTGWLVVLRDMTEHRALESRLRRAQRLESIGTLAGGIAHDLNNILTPILLATEILDKQIQDPSMKPVVSTLRLTAQRGKNIVKQVLTFARGAEEQYAIQQMDELAREMVSLVTEIFPKHIRVVTEINPVLPVYGDATQIDQVIMNLCVNARDAMPGGGTLTIGLSNVTVDETYTRLETGVTPGSYVVLTISDTGTGITPAIRAKIFEPFFTTKDVGKGTGLGLSSVQAIARAHKGFVTLYSEPGQGAQFRVYFPAIEQIKDADSIDELPVLASGNGETILLVDDEQAVLQISKEILEASGYNVLTARNGAEAIMKFSESDPGSVKLVICDLNMPAMSGAATVMSLREMEPNINVLISSGSLSDEDLRLLQPLNVQGYLTKPFTAMQYLTVVYAAVHSNVQADKGA